MKIKALAAIFLVVAALPIATAQVPGVDSTDSLNESTVSESETETGENASSDDDTESSEEYTELYVDSDHRHPELEPGETGTFNVSVKNGEDESVTVDPHLYVPPVGGHEERINESWISIEGDTTLEAGEEQTFTVTIDAPKDAKSGYYGGQIAFTDETVTYPGRPARPVHATGINVEIWQEPTVTIVSGEYIRGQIEAGDSVTRQIVIENTGEQAVPVNPQLKTERRHHHRGGSSTIDPSWVDIDAPNQIAAGETGTVTVTVSVPESAENGRYDTRLDLGLKDPVRREGDSYWQEVNMNFEVWSQPDEPFEASFDVSEDAENVSLTLSPRSSHYRSGSSSEDASFDVTFVSPSGERFEAERVKLTDSGFVDLSSQSRDRAVEQQGEYGVRNSGQQFVYRVADPDAGEWTVEIMPENTIGFHYEIVRNEPLDSVSETNATA